MFRRIILSIGVVATAVFAYMAMQPEPVTIIDDGVTMVHESRGESVLDVLEETGIVIDEADVVTPALSADIPLDRVIQIERARTVSLQIGYGQIETIETRERTVEDVLLRYGVSVRDGDDVYPGVRTPITSGMTIRYQPVVALDVIVGDVAKTVYTMAQTVEQALQEANVTVSDKDTVEPALTTPVREGMTITVNMSRDVVQYESRLVPFEIIKEEDDTLALGETEVVQVGVPGLERTRYALTVENGTITNRTETSVETLRTVRPQIIKLGTKVPPERETNQETEQEAAATTEPSSPFREEAEIKIEETPRAEDALDFTSAKQLLVEATAYTNNAEDTVTFDGRVLTRSGYDVTDTILYEGMRIIAVDPAIIPLGTRVYVEGFGMAIALDTGSAIKGNKIDVMMDSKEEAVTFGRQPLTIWVIPKQEEKEGTDDA
ncbi:3D domain-containing protein [Exiguobacterium aurantiacum]|uniref:Ubiquitin-like domain-containing protein n=2 Tax=Exiguobacterium TaxID=33986 RepID=A0ABY5FNL1_9BACL|nr:3D domain-containing protein [Exiguobacterium aurantiacum]UTT42990.1 ubiquitin-like domain-containing protein [Exiguobacterium aurantiacum]